MAVARVRHIQTIRRKTRRGIKVHHYHRITGERLPDDEAARLARALAINAGLGGDGSPAGHERPGTFADLVARYRASAKFLDRSAATRKDYSPHLDAIVAAWGDLPVAGLKRKHAYAMQEDLAATPRAANKRLTILSRLLNFGIDLDEDTFGTTNPLRGFERLATGEGYHPWPEHVIAAFARAAYGELRAAVIAGLLNTGQRASDVVAMRWQHYDGSGMEVVQQKTRERLWIPASAAFKRLVDPLPRRGTVIFTTKTGRAWTPHNLYMETTRLLQAIGHPGYSPHGLRFRAAGRLVEAGASWDDVAAVLGHRTMEQARRYAERRERAEISVARLDRETTGAGRKV